MARQTTTLEGAYNSPDGGDEKQEPAWALCVAWSQDPSRLGQALVVSPVRRTPVAFGREVLDDGTTVSLVAQRPGQNVPVALFENPYLSRRHIELLADGAGLRVANVGKRPLFVNGVATTHELVRPGDTLEIRGLVLFVVVRRALVFRHTPSLVPSNVPFGESDLHGVVGESEAVWLLREHIAFHADRQAHVLVTGESGTGKELVAQAMHALSARANRRLVSRNAATLPPGIIDAELFGNAANYPNGGMPERQGLIGEAHESTLFLDEIGELPLESQAHLLRVLDEGGEYQRLGEAKKRKADLRVVAATNRPISELKHDLVSRLTLRLDVPSLNDRREDIPLLARHLLARISARDPKMKARFGRSPMITCELVRALVQHNYRTHVRELDSLLWQAMANSRGDFVELGSAVASALAPPPSVQTREVVREVSAEQIRAALARHAGVREKAWRELALPSRHALHRLMKKYGIDADDDGDDT